MDTWETFQLEKTQASEFLLSKQYAIVPKLQQMMATALAELEGLLKKALSGPFMDPTQEQRSTESKLVSIEHQFKNTASHLCELHHTYVTFTGTENPHAFHHHPEIRVEVLCPVTLSKMLSKPQESHTFVGLSSKY